MQTVDQLITFKLCNSSEYVTIRGLLEINLSICYQGAFLLVFYKTLAPWRLWLKAGAPEAELGAILRKLYALIYMTQLLQPVILSRLLLVLTPVLLRIKMVASSVQVTVIAGDVITQYRSPCTALQTYSWVETAHISFSCSCRWHYNGCCQLRPRARWQLHQGLNAAYMHCSFTFGTNLCCNGPN
jgi:hypothetical protein